MDSHSQLSQLKATGARVSEPATPLNRRGPLIATIAGSAPGPAPLNLSRLMACAGEVAFSWDLTRDLITFDTHAPAIFGIDMPGGRCQGAAFLLRIDSADANLRAAALSHLPRADALASAGIPYRAVYSFHPAGRTDPRVVIVEEDGRWLAGSDGRPALASGIMRIVTGRYQAEQRLRFRGDHDALTGQLNRAALFERLQAALDNADAEKSPIGFMVAAVNGLNTINETFGFAVGDEMLAGCARILRRHLRSRDELGRYASNKFGIIVHDCGPGVIRIVADRLMTALRSATIPTSVSRLPATLSIGGMSITDPSLGAATVVSNALQALDQARSRRLDSFVSFEADREDHIARQRNARLASSLVRALDEDRLRLELQPIVDAKTGRAEHYECLLRLIEPDGSIVSAGDFMPIAEQLGLSRLIDLRTLKLATRLLSSYPSVKLALNVSGLTSADNEWLVSLHRLTGGNRQITTRLTIEITETAAIKDLDQLMVFADTIKEIGCHVSIDDFGVGYTNFRILKLLKADIVKIDGTFIKNVCNDAGDQVFVKSMVELARTFNMVTVAEWVGDEKTARYLTDAGIDYLQGYHFGASASPEALLGAPVA